MIDTKKKQLVIHNVTLGLRMILVYHHECVKYTLYKCILKIMDFESIFYVRKNDKYT